MRPLAFEYDLSQHIDEAAPAMLFNGNTTEELRDWQERFRAKVLSLLGILPERAALVVEYEEEKDRETYIRHKIRYQTEAAVWVPAYLLVPKGVSAAQPAAAILCLHGHGRFGKDSIVGIKDTPDRTEEVERLQYDFGRRFAEQGYVVLAPDLRGFGERQPHYPDPKPDYCCRNYMAATLLGRTVVGYQLCDLHAALDVLQSLPYVDSEKLAAAGLSYGGRMTMMISAMDSRITACVPSGCLNMYQERYQNLHQCGSQLIPSLLLYGDTPEIFSLIAPRPMVIEWGLRDKLIPHEWAERGLARIRNAYAASGQPDNLSVHQFDKGHVFEGTVGAEMLHRWRQSVE